jgi:hypothetical protein
MSKTSNRPARRILQQYVDKKLSRDYIAGMHGCHPDTVTKWFMHFDMTCTAMVIEPVNIEVGKATVIALPIGDDGIDRYVLPGYPGAVVTGAKKATQAGVIMDFLMTKRCA